MTDFNNCLPVLKVEVCHLKDHFQERSFSVTSFDNDNEILPVKFSLLDQGDTKNWNWILKNLRWTFNPSPSGLIEHLWSSKGEIMASWRSCIGIPPEHFVRHLVSEVTLIQEPQKRRYKDKGICSNLQLGNVWRDYREHTFGWQECLTVYNGVTTFVVQ